jgi:hypothetical protein
MHEKLHGEAETVEKVEFVKAVKGKKAVSRRGKQLDLLDG